MSQVSLAGNNLVNYDYKDVEYLVKVRCYDVHPVLHTGLMCVGYDNLCLKKLGE